MLVEMTNSRSRSRPVSRDSRELEDAIDEARRSLSSPPGTSERSYCGDFELNTREESPMSTVSLSSSKTKDHPVSPSNSDVSMQDEASATTDETRSIASSRQSRKRGRSLSVKKVSGQVFHGLKILPFAGTKDEDIAEWLDQYETIAQVQGWGSDAMKRGIAAYFTGLPKRWYINRMKQPSERPRMCLPSEASLDDIPWKYLTWKQVKKLLLQQYLTTEPRSYLVDNLLKPQKSSDSIVEHFHRKLDLCQRLKYSDADTVHYIRLTLRKDVRPFVSTEIVRPSILLRKLKQLAQDFEPHESVREQHRESRRDRDDRLKTERSSSRRERSRDRNHHGGNREPLYSRNRTGRLYVKRQFNQRESASKPTCYNCGKVGHYKRDCTEMDKSKGESSRGGFSGLSAEKKAESFDSNKKTSGKSINKLDINQAYPEFVLNVTVLGEEVRALLDSGAPFTCMSFARYKAFKVEIPLAQQSVDARGADGRSMNVAGVALVRYRYRQGDSDGSIDLVTVVIKELTSDIILGRDFIAQVKPNWFGSDEAVVTSGRTSEAVVEKVQIPVNKEKAENASEMRTVICAKELTIPPKSTVLAKIVIDGEKCNGVVTDGGFLQGRARVVNSLISGEDELVVPITNFGVEQRVIGEGSKIGQFETCRYMTDAVSEAEGQNHWVFMDNTEELKLEGGSLQIGKDLSVDEKETLTKVLVKYSHLFSFNGQLGNCRVLEHSIDTGDSKPVHSAPYRQSAKLREASQRQIEEWLEAGVVTPSKSPWASPVVVVPKKDGSLRMCVDLRKVNSLTKRDVYPLPTVEDALSSLNGAKYFSSLDLNQGYMQIKMAENDQQKTAFITQDGLFEFKRMPFGLCNAPATFQRCMDMVLSGLKWNQCLVYLDDVVVFAPTLEEHNERLSLVFERISEAELTIKPTKCAFGVRELRFLGHVIGENGIRMDSDKIEAIKQLEAPKSISDVRSFIGSSSFYRRFIRDFSRVAEPLSRLTRKNTTFTWGEEQQKSFEKIKDLITKQPVLCHYDSKLPIELRTDACGYGLGAILMHVYPDKTRRVISYASRLLQGAERNYPITELECLAIVWAVEKFKIFLQGTKFTVVTDHQALTWLKSKRELSGRLMRWTLLLQPFDFEINYRKGSNHRDVDHLSRFPRHDINHVTIGRRGTNKSEDGLFTGGGKSSSEEKTRKEPPNISICEFREKQEKDTFCKKVKSNLSEYPNFEVRNEVLIKRGNEQKGAGPIQRVVPESMFEDVMYSLHDDALNGHTGPRKTLAKFRDRYFIPNDYTRVKKYVTTCHSCQTRKAGWTRAYGLLQPLKLATKPFERIGIDTLGPFMRSQLGNRKIIVVVDHLTKYAITKAVPQENAVEIANFLVKEVILKFGPPEYILSDRGKSFGKEILKQIYAEFDSRHICTTAYHPQSNGLTERLNKTLTVMLSMYVNETHKDWDEYLPFVTYAYNTSIQDSTGKTPLYLLTLNSRQVSSDLNMNHSQRLEHIFRARELALAANRHAQDSQKRQYDKKRHLRSYNVGDEVLVYRPRGYIGQTTKLRHLYEGPYIILEKRGEDIYKVKDARDGRELSNTDVVNSARLKPYYRRVQLS